ncbi:MAG: ABC transporter permease [Myxococcota bacterium]
MIDVDRWFEILEGLARHPLRTALTMGSVAWGTFVLVVLLGTGAGLQNNVQWQFRDDATNSVWVYRGQTTKPYQGQPVGRRIVFDLRDYDAVRGRIGGIEHITGRFYLWSGGTVSYRDRSSAYSVRGVHPDHQYLEKTLIASGRFLDDLDVADKRKVAVIGTKIVEYLFRGADPLGEYLNLGQVPFQVVGVFTDAGGEGELEQIYVPITTAQATFGQGTDQVHQLMLTLEGATEERAEQVSNDLRALLAERLRFDPTDNQAIRVRNNVEEFSRIQGLFSLLDGFVWLVGLGTVTAGVVGVSNITLVSVRERASELALRKALGATPAAIVRAVVEEAVVLTATSGYLGIVLGVGLLVALRAWMPENEYVRDPQIQLWPALAAAAVLTVAGGVAGFFPAWFAARVPPVEGLRGG